MNLRERLNQNGEFQGYQQVDDRTAKVGVIVTLQVLGKEHNEKGKAILVNGQVIKIKDIRGAVQEIC